ncbi:amino acid permease [Leptolyngbya sp. KIOST-1]|uniref:amino acid permease n=1 Tax=Leptolyngbya sp. KIOST-1 TaxID=1229172 RepID=UPI000907D1ED|nr:amino acid permease [Leptolyngbya sp. KIOST-1]
MANQTQTQPAQREQKEQQEQGLVREMSLFNALAIGLGTMLGAGIFVLSGTAAQEAGPAAAVSFAIAGLICLPIAMTVSELVTAMPQEGGSYYLISRTLGAVAAAVVGPANWLGLMFATGFYLIGFAEYVADFVEVPLRLSELGAGLFFIGLNYRGAKLSGTAQTVIVAILVLILAGFAGLGFFNVDADLHDPFAPFGWGTAFGVVGLIFVSFSGFEKVSTVAEEIQQPGRNLPRAIIGSVVAATLIYVAVVYVLTGVLPYDQMDEFDTPLLAAAEQFMGNPGRIVVSVGALLATASSANAAILASSRINFAMGRDQILPRWFGHIHPRHLTPSRSILVTGGIALLLSLTEQAAILAEISSALFMVSYALIVMGLIVVRRAAPAWYQPTFRVPLFPWLPLVGGGAAIVVIGTLDRFSQLSGLGLAAASLLWYYLWARRRTTIEGELGHWLHDAQPLRSTLGRSDLQGERQYGEILLPLTEDRPALGLVNLATALAQGRPGTRLSGLQIVPVPYNLSLQAGQHQLHRRRDRLQQQLDQTLAQVQTPGVELEARVQGARNVDSAIVAIAQHQPQTHLVVLGWHRQSRASPFSPSTSRAVLNNAPCDVAVLRDRQLDQIQRILVAVADSPHALTGLHLARYLQQATAATVVVFHGVTPSADRRGAEGTVRQWVEAEFGPRQQAVRVQVESVDSVEQAILAEAAQGYDLVIVGASQRWFAQRWLFSATADHVAEKAPCSVLLVRRHEPRRLLRLERLLARLRRWL